MSRRSRGVTLALSRIVLALSRIVLTLSRIVLALSRIVNVFGYRLYGHAFTRLNFVGFVLLGIVLLIELDLESFFILIYFDLILREGGNLSEGVRAKVLTVFASTVNTDVVFRATLRPSLIIAGDITVFVDRFRALVVEMTDDLTESVLILGAVSNLVTILAVMIISSTSKRAVLLLVIRVTVFTT